MIYLFAGWCLGWLITFPILSACNNADCWDDDLGDFIDDDFDDFIDLAGVSLFLWPVFWAMLAWGLVLYLREK
jgi:hypothetical protein